MPYWNAADFALPTDTHGWSASDWSEEMRRLRDLKPRPLDKLWRRPTPEQAAEHGAAMRAWNSAYRRATKMQKQRLEEQNSMSKINGLAGLQAALGFGSPARTITSQHYLDDAVVEEKRAAHDYVVTVSPDFELDGETYRVVLDGHHSLAAALADGVEPVYRVATALDSDTVSLLEYGEIDEFMEVHTEGEWIDAIDRSNVW